MANPGFVSRTQVTAHAPVDIEIRQACSTDSAALIEFLTGLSPRVRYLRFFSGAAPTSGAMLRILTGGVGCTDALVAVESGVIVGHGRRGMGVGSALVRCLMSRAQARGATTIVMEVLAENRQVITMITDHWPVTYQDQSGAYLTIHARLPQPGDQESPGVRAPRLAGAEPPRAEEELLGEQLASVR